MGTQRHKELISKLTKTIHKKENVPQNTEEVVLNDNEETNDQEVTEIPKPPIKGTGTRSKFTCGSCGLNVWAKPSANILCGDCGVRLEII